MKFDIIFNLSIFGSFEKVNLCMRISFSFERYHLQVRSYIFVRDNTDSLKCLRMVALKNLFLPSFIATNAKIPYLFINH